jgi:hypothetical protein
MQNNNYLPKENELSVLPQSILRYLWSNKVINPAIGVRSEKDAREWFRQRPHLLQEFVKREIKLQACIEELQKEVSLGLCQVILDEQKALPQFAKPRKRQQVDVNFCDDIDL